MKAAETFSNHASGYEKNNSKCELTYKWPRIRFNSHILFTKFKGENFTLKLFLFCYLLFLFCYLLFLFCYLLFLRLPMSSNITTHLKSLHWLPVKVRSTYKIACLCYHCHSSTAPSVWNSITNDVRSPHHCHLSLVWRHTCLVQLTKIELFLWSLCISAWIGLVIALLMAFLKIELMCIKKSN